MADIKAAFFDIDGTLLPRLYCHAVEPGLLRWATPAMPPSRLRIMSRTIL